jgi:hypothetical protein
MSLPARIHGRRSRRQREAFIHCSHCLKSVQIETFKLHVMSFWDSRSHKWISLPADCRGCEHDHTPTTAEMVHINKVRVDEEQSSAKRRRLLHHSADASHDPAAGVDDIIESDDEDGHDIAIEDGHDIVIDDVPDYPDLDDMEVHIGGQSALVGDVAHENSIPEWMSYRPGLNIPPCSVRRIDRLVADYHLIDTEVQDVIRRVDMLTLYLWYIRGNCSEVDMGLLLVNRSYGGSIPFDTLTVDGLCTYLGFRLSDQERGWDDGRRTHWEFQQIVACPALGCARCSLFSTLVLEEGQLPTCGGVEFPHHPHARRRDPCGTPLTAPPIRIRRLLTWKPNWLLYYKSPIAYIREYMLRPTYPDMNEQWRLRPPYYHEDTDEEIGCDFYDFAVWRSFHKPGGRMDWSRRGNALLMGNMDWYQPFEHTTASLGLVWMVNLCIPRAHRYKRHNVMLVAVLPGLSEKELRCDRLWNRSRLTF